MNIVTCLVSDINERDKHIKYKALGRLDKKSKQRIYWRIAYTYFAVSTRINKIHRHILYTNETEEFVYQGFNFKKEIQDLGVEVRNLPFKNFYIPNGKSVLFKNAYYKFELFRELGKEKIPSLFTDLDCVWVNKWHNLEELIEENDLLLYDVYSRSDRPHEKHPNNTSMKDMGDLFKKISLNYQKKYPIWYGGEFIATKPNIFKELYKQLFEVFQWALSDQHASLTFPNGESLLDGDEYLSSYVYNNSSWKIYIVNNHIKRIWTLYNFNNVNELDLNMNIWHLPAEKNSGLILLFKKISQKNSEFRDIKEKQIPQFLSEYLGIRKRNTFLKYKRIIFYFKNKILGRLVYFFSG